MRLLKLVAMGLAGYAIYEMSRSIWSSVQDSQPGGSAGSPARQADERRSQLSGGGEGMRVQVADTDGGTRSEIAGRGVIRS